MRFSKVHSITIATLAIMSTIALAVPVTDDAEAAVATDRIVLVEIITAGWCSNCVIADGALDGMDDDYSRDELVVLAWHRSDALSFADGNARQTYYGNPYQPDVFFDGVVEVAGNKGNVDANRNAYEVAYDQRASIAPGLVIALDGYTDTTSGAGEVWVNVTADVAPTQTDLRLHVVVFEDDFGPWNGGNGVNYHDWVAREMLTGTSGESITPTAGQTLDLHYTFDASAYAQDNDQVGIVAFVQAQASKEVLQTAYAKEHITTTPNSIPEVRDGTVTPAVGDTSTTFSYEVQYRDADNERPVTAKVFIDDLGYDLWTSSSGPWTDWQTFTHETALTVGADHTYRFSFSDGIEEVRLPDPGPGPTTYSGPEVGPPTMAPTLGNGAVTPSGGDALTLRTFSVVYTDGENDAPTVAQVVIDGVAMDMTPGGTDYTQGVTFTYSTTLAAGDHEYHFGFGDGVHGARLPTTGSMHEMVPEGLHRITVLSDNAMDGQVAEDEVVTLVFDDSDVDLTETFTFLWESDLVGTLSSTGTLETALSPGTHNITLTVTTSNGDGHKDWIIIESHELEPHVFIQDISGSPDTPVDGDEVTVTIVIGNDGYAPVTDVEVRLLDASDSVVDETVVDVTIAVGSTHSVTLMLTAQEGGSSYTIDVAEETETLTLLVNENYAPTVDLKVDGISDGKLESEPKKDLTFGAEATDPEGDDLTYLWDFGDGSNATGTEVVHSYGDTGTYVVSVSVTDARGATTTRTFEVILESSTDAPGFGILIALLAIALGSVIFVRYNKRW